VTDQRNRRVKEQLIGFTRFNFAFDYVLLVAAHNVYSLIIAEIAAESMGHNDLESCGGRQ
jgi:hypothetical protein